MIDHEITLRRKERYRNKNITMKLERIKEIQKETAYPDSISVQQALLKVWNECQQTLTDESDCSRIHYESNKDAEPLEESEWISVNDRMPEEFRREPKYIEFRTLSGMLIDGYSKRNAFYDSKYGSIITSIVTHWRYKNNEPKEEETMFIAEVREVNSDIKIYYVVNSRNKDEAVLKVEKYYEIKAELNGRCYVTNIKDYEYIS